MKLSYNFTEQDYIEFTIYHHQSSDSYQKQSIVLRYLVPLIFVPVIIGFGTIVFKQNIGYWIVVSLIFYLYWSIPFNRRHRKLMVKEIEGNLKRSDNKNLFGEKEVEITNDSVITTDLMGNKEYLLKTGIQNIVVHKDSIYVYISSVQAIVIVLRDTGMHADEVLEALQA